jgi:hypothetical protein
MSPHPILVRAPLACGIVLAERPGNWNAFRFTRARPRVGGGQERGGDGAMAFL